MIGNSPNAHHFEKNLIKNQWYFEWLCSKLIIVDFLFPVGKEKSEE